MVQLRYTGNDPRDVPETLLFPGRRAERSKAEGDDELSRLERTLDSMRDEVDELVRDVEDVLRPLPFTGAWRDESDDFPPFAA